MEGRGRKTRRQRARWTHELRASSWNTTSNIIKHKTVVFFVYCQLDIFYVTRLEQNHLHLQRLRLTLKSGNVVFTNKLMTVSCKRVFTIFNLLGKAGIKLQNMLFVSSLYSFSPAIDRTRWFVLRFPKLLWITYIINLCLWCDNTEVWLRFFATIKKKKKSDLVRFTETLRFSGFWLELLLL